MGPSGCGKTTLLMCIAGLLPISSGVIRFADVEMNRLRVKQKTALRLSQIGIVYQFGELIPELTPVENVAIPGLLAGLGRSEARRQAMGLLDELGVVDLAGAQTATLSGGERQRVAVARALINQPSVLLADEPTGSLDEQATTLVADLLFDLPKRHGCALVVVTHNPLIAERADDKLRLHAGRLVEADA